jgi:predicted DCC family thiol-disulfide oxidoreductase YuxK
MTEAERERICRRPVLLYDGVCALCNGVVRFVLRHDRAGAFLFAALQSGTARDLLRESPALDGVVLVIDAMVPEQRVYRRSDAVAQVLRMLGGPWKILGGMLAVVPRGVREVGYGAVARVRYRLFGRYEVCPIPRPQDRERFVDVAAG